MPGRFGAVRLLGPSYSLRCVVFHNISAAESPFTKGIHISMTPKEFEDVLGFLAAHYTPVRLDDVLEKADGRRLPPRAVLVTFDDAYASVVDVAAPLCKKLGVPAVFFVNAAFLDNQHLAPDNLVCYAANMLGMDSVNAAARMIRDADALPMNSLAEIFTSFFPSITLTEREAFLEELRRAGGINERRLAQEAGLYLTAKQLRTLVSFDFEIGNHTYSHVHCRSLSGEDFAREVDRNQVELETLSGRKVRSFSQPYGSSIDLTLELVDHLRRSGHEVAFLSESVANPRDADCFHLDRINPRVYREDALFFDLEVLPRLRTVRNRLFLRSQSSRTHQHLPLKTGGAFQNQESHQDGA